MKQPFTMSCLLIFVFSRQNGGNMTPSCAPEVMTDLGRVRGTWTVSRTGKLLKTFYGIPYGEPTSGEMRFKPPVASKPWDQTIDATEIPPACYQKRFLPSLRHIDPYYRQYFPSLDDPFSEDCLKLNIYVPWDLPYKAPVMVFIYGGGFSRGSANSAAYDSISTLASEERVIVVSFNYRVSLFGFLYFGNEDAPGNVGLMDQQLLLRWVQNHIGDFGGNPNEVTIFGQSAGGASVGYHLLLPSSEGLFKRAILQSGAPHASFAFGQKATLMKYGRELAESVGCWNREGNTTATMKCLRETDPITLMENEPQVGYDYVYIFKPVMDGTFVANHPLELLKKMKRSPKMEIMTSVTDDEVTLFMAFLYPFIFTLNENVKVKMDDIYYTMYDLLGLGNTVIDVLYNVYAKDKDHNPDTALFLRTVIEMGSDGIFTCPMTDIEEAFKKDGNKVFKMVLLQRHQEPNIPSWFGAHHALELRYLFGNPLDNSSLPAVDHSETALSANLMRYWGNFARTGNPNKNLGGSRKTPYWPEYTMGKEEYLSVNVNGSLVLNHYKRQKCHLWRNVVPKLISTQKEPYVTDLDLSRAKV